MKKLLSLLLVMAFMFPVFGVAFAEEPELTPVQRNSLNMLNYLTVLTYEINQAKNSRLFVEQVYSELLNNTNPSAVDDGTYYQYHELFTILEGYRMVNVKRDRLTYIFERNKAQAIRETLPSVGSFLSMVVSTDRKRLATSILYMVADATKNYQSALSEAEFEFLKDGWELDDEETEFLNQSRKSMFDYMVEMAGTYGLPDEYTLTEKTVQAFVEAKNNTNVDSRIRFLESNAGTYRHLGEYWLVLADSYYENEEYEKCLSAIDAYEKLGISIFRKDFALAERLPLAIVAAEEIMPETDFVPFATQYTEKLVKNTDPDNWSMRFYAAQTYLTLYEKTGNEDFLREAYSLALDNVNILVPEQREKNGTYLADIREEKIKDDATKEQKKDIKAYNKMLKEVRKTELPPVSDPLLLNCELLFACAEKLELSPEQKKQIEGILHNKGEALFLTEKVDDSFRFAEAEEIGLVRSFNGKNFVISAGALSERSTVKAVLISKDGEEIPVEDWVIESVERADKSDFTTFTATYSSKTMKKHDFTVGEKVVVTVVPLDDVAVEPYEFSFTCTATRATIKEAATQAEEGAWKDAAENAGSALSFWKDAAMFEEVEG